MAPVLAIVYAAFGSFCDHKASITRGWIVGWNAATLAPLPHNNLTDTQTSPESDYYLSSVWMSGYGLAADAIGNIYFVTGNSDPKRNVYDGVTDIPESVVKLSPKLDAVKSMFTRLMNFLSTRGITTMAPAVFCCCRHSREPFQSRRCRREGRHPVPAQSKRSRRL